MKARRIERLGQPVGPGGQLFEHDASFSALKVASRLFAYARPFKLLLIVSLLGLVGYSAAVAAFPWLIKVIINDHIATGDLDGLNTLGVILAGIVIGAFVANYVQSLTLSYISQRLLTDLRNELFAHMHTLSLSFFTRHPLGQVMSRVQNDVRQVQQFLGLLISIAADLVSLIGILIAMIALNPVLSLIAIAFAPVLFFGRLLWQRRAIPAYSRVRSTVAGINGDLQESITGIRVIQSSNRQEVNAKRFKALNDSNFTAYRDAARMDALLSPGVILFTGISLAILFSVGGQMALSGTVEVGTLVAFAIYIERITDPIGGLSERYAQIQRGMVSAARIFDLLDMEPDVKDAADAVSLPRARGEVSFENVDFAYKDDTPTLTGVSFKINAGETVALVGHTGAGKTTIMALLARFYDVTGGRITVDGHDLRSVRRSSLSAQVSMVTQEPLLFSATIAENIRFNRTEATDEEVERAARLAGAHRFISRLDNGFNTMLWERGGNLSQGQRQLISFARALLAEPRILLLDEATASVDLETEQTIQQGLRELLKGRTSLVIAHRLATVRDADRIVLFDHGRIVEEGSHDELLQRGGVYANYWKLQSLPGE